MKIYKKKFVGSLQFNFILLCLLFFLPIYLYLFFQGNDHLLGEIFSIIGMIFIVLEPHRYLIIEKDKLILPRLREGANATSFYLHEIRHIKLRYYLLGGVVIKLYLQDKTRTHNLFVKKEEMPQIIEDLRQLGISVNE